MTAGACSALIIVLPHGHEASFYQVTPFYLMVIMQEDVTVRLNTGGLLRVLVTCIILQQQQFLYRMTIIV